MISICAWCGKFKGEVPPYEKKDETHGMCDVCKARVIAEIKEMRKLERAKSKFSSNIDTKIYDVIKTGGLY
ncbi:MAG: hypothetical protein KAX15_01885 [Candidatus Omnitrophica bacterium]|nr:hypothetical protein [Candidatus Omnitrophota bacterium]